MSYKQLLIGLLLGVALRFACNWIDTTQLLEPSPVAKATIKSLETQNWIPQQIPGNQKVLVNYEAGVAIWPYGSITNVSPNGLSFISVEGHVPGTTFFDRWTVSRAYDRQMSLIQSIEEKAFIAKLER